MRWRPLLTYFLAFSLMLILTVPLVYPMDFGDKDDPTVYWNTFWNKFNAHSDWDLEYYNGSSWESVKQDLEVIKDYRLFLVEENTSVPSVKSQANFVKITLNFTASYTADYRLTFGIDLDVKNYTVQLDKWRYLLEYQDYNVFFDWSDLKDIGGITISHGVKAVDGEDWFWFRIRRDNVPQGYNIVLDPSFGRTDVGGSTFSCVNQFVGSYDAPGDGDGTADSITAYLTDTRAHASETLRAKCALYLHSDDSFVADTDENTGNLGTGWVTFTFSSPPAVTDGTDYWMKVWANAGQSGDCRVSASNVGSNYLVIDVETYGYSADPACPDPEVETSGYSNWRASIYCNYTVSGGTEYTFYGDVNASSTINSHRSWSFPKYGDVTQQFTVDSSKTLDFSRFSEINQQFTIDSSRIWSFSRYLDVAQVFTIDGWVQTVQNLLSLYGSISQTFTVDSARTWMFALYKTVDLEFTIDSWLEFLERTYNFYGSIVQVFTVDSSRTWAFTSYRDVTQVFTIDGWAQASSSLIQYFFGSIGLQFTVDGWTDLPVPSAAELDFGILGFVFGAFAVVMVLYIWRRRGGREDEYEWM